MFTSSSHLASKYGSNVPILFNVAKRFSEIAGELELTLLEAYGGQIKYLICPLKR